jgi:hypothetical protein
MVDDEKQQIMDNMPDPEDREALRDWHLARRLQRENANAAVNQKFVPVPLAPTWTLPQLSQAQSPGCASPLA